MAKGTLVNDTLDALNQGVSQQYQEGRYTSQVSEMINCTPTLVRGILRRNPTEAVAKLYAPTMAPSITDAFVYTYDRGTSNEQYMVVIPGDGSIHTFNLDGTHLYSESGFDYLTISPLLSAKEEFDAITIGDHTFIINKTIEVQFNKNLTAPSFGYSDYALYWIKKTASVVTNQYQDTTTGQSGNRMEGYDYTINNFQIKGVEDTRPNETPINMNSSYRLAEEIAANSSDSFMNLSQDGIAYNLNYTPYNNIEWGDSFGNEASVGIWKNVDSSSDLPATLPRPLDKFKVRISGGTEGNYDDYYMEYSHENKTWQEIPAPESYTTLDDNTMPHVLYRLSSGFKFDTYQEISEDGSTLLGETKWVPRHTRGLDTLDDPSFIGRKLTNIFFHRNRLGFITSDNIILSSTSWYGNFFYQTALNVLDDDPIDLAIASTDVTVLRRAVSLSGQLILFADDTQFSLGTYDGVLTPNTADISHISNYTYDKFPNAQSIGNKIYFISSIGGDANVFSYKIKDENTIVSEAENVTLHVPTYLPSPINSIVGHDVLGYIFFTTKNKPRELRVLNAVEKGGQEIQNAFHTWSFRKNIVSVHIINTDLYILFEDRDLVKISLNIPGNITSVDYRDSYPSITEANDYISYIRFSKFFVRDKSKLGAVRGRYQIRTLQYTINDYSKYMTTIYSTDKMQIQDELFYGPIWEDNTLWIDGYYWQDEIELYKRIYKNDEKVTVMGNNDNIGITFRNNPDEPSKGFELITANVEGFFYQRSTRI